MAYNTFRWVGSGNTGATSADIFNWNYPGNWEIRKYFGAGSSGGWKFTGTTWVPGPFDTALFGTPSPFSTDGSYVSPQHRNSTTKVKSPCLFGGFSGNAAGGTWSGSGISGSAGGTTYTSALKDLYINQNFNGTTTALDAGTGPTNLPFLSYNDTAYNFNGQLPFGGGLKPSAECRDTLLWISRNYPNMGITVDESYAGDTFSVPMYSAGAMDNLTLKIYNGMRVGNRGNRGSSPITAKFVTAYSPLSGNYATTGFTGINAPEVRTTVNVISSRPINIFGGAVKNLECYPTQIKMIDPSSGITGFGLPDFVVKNMVCGELATSTANKTLIDSDVNFGSCNVECGLIDNFIVMADPTFNIVDKTLITRSESGAEILASSYIGTVFSTLYPGNTGYSSVYDIGTLRISNLYAPFSDGLGIYRSFSGQTLSTPYGVQKKNMAIRFMTNSPSSQALNDLKAPFPADTTLVSQQIAPGTHIVKLGSSGITGTQSINDIEIIDNGNNHIETSLLRFDGNVNVDTIDVVGGRIDFWGHRGTVRIANIFLEETGCLDLVNPNKQQSQIFFGLISNGGVSGGIEVRPYGGYSNGGFIGMEEGERLFNISTTKFGRLTTTSSTAASLTVNDSIPSTITPKETA